MSGAIHLEASNSWVVANWVFDLVISTVHKHLKESESAELLRLIEKSQTGLRFLPLNELGPTDLAIFREALDDAYAELEQKGSESFADPEFYPAFMERFKELLDMVRLAQSS